MYKNHATEHQYASEATNGISIECMYTQCAYRILGYTMRTDNSGCIRGEGGYGTINFKSLLWTELYITYSREINTREV